MLSLMNISCCI